MICSDRAAEVVEELLTCHRVSISLLLTIPLLFGHCHHLQLTSLSLNLCLVITCQNHLVGFESPLNCSFCDYDLGVLRTLIFENRSEVNTKSRGCVISTRKHHAIHELGYSQCVALNQVCSGPVYL